MPTPSVTRTVAGFADWDLPTAAHRIEQGLASTTLDGIKETLGLSSQELADALLLSPRTISRRRTAGERLTPAESERAYRLGRLAALAVGTLGGVEHARAWMREENFALGDVRPLDLARTEPGARLVERLLRQIPHGIPV
ncbi:MAG: antitoxin Xre-like helix-turn-helix domain-containing protein [Bacteroidota bacterium]